MSQSEKPNWWRDIDVPGLLGCVLLVFMTYGIFWYYTEAIKGTFDIDAEAPKRASLLWTEAK